MILLDTNVISGLMRRRPDPIIVGWLDAQAAESIWTSAVTVFEIRFGIELLSPGRKRNALEAAFEAMLRDDLGGYLGIAVSGPPANLSMGTETTEIGRAAGIGDTDDGCPIVALV